MNHQDAIQQAIDHQIEIERKAQAWDDLLRKLDQHGNTLAQELAKTMREMVPA